MRCRDWKDGSGSDCRYSCHCSDAKKGNLFSGCVYGSDGDFIGSAFFLSTKSTF